MHLPYRCNSSHACDLFECDLLVHVTGVLQCGGEEQSVKHWLGFSLAFEISWLL